MDWYRGQNRKTKAIIDGCFDRIQLDGLVELKWTSGMRIYIKVRDTFILQCEKKVSRTLIPLCEIEKGRTLVSVRSAVRYAKKAGFSTIVALEACLQDQLRKANIKKRVRIEDAA